MAEHNHFVYILKCKDNTLYTGYTIDVAKRIKVHQSGKGAKYTRGRGPFQVVFTESYSSKEEALRKEYAIKQLTRQEKDQMILNKNKEVTHYEDPEEL